MTDRVMVPAVDVCGTKGTQPPPVLLFYILQHFRSPIMLGFDGLLRIASGFVGLCQAVGVVGGRWGQEMFCKCGAEEWTSRNCPVFCVWT